MSNWKDEKRWWWCRHLAGETGTEWRERAAAEEGTESLASLVRQIVPFHMAHNAEPEAVDLLLEVPWSNVKMRLLSGVMHPIASASTILSFRLRFNALLCPKQAV